MAISTSNNSLVRIFGWLRYMYIYWCRYRAKLNHELRFYYVMYIHIYKCYNGSETVCGYQWILCTFFRVFQDWPVSLYFGLIKMRFMQMTLGPGKIYEVVFLCT